MRELMIGQAAFVSGGESAFSDPDPSQDHAGWASYKDPTGAGIDWGSFFIGLAVNATWDAAKGLWSVVVNVATDPANNEQTGTQHQYYAPGFAPPPPGGGNPGNSNFVGPPAPSWVGPR